MPRDQKLVNRITWDGRGRVDVHESLRKKYGLKELVDIYRDHIGLSNSTWWTESNYDWSFIPQESLNILVEELRNAHRLLHENSQSNNQLVVARRSAEDNAYALQGRISNLEQEKSNLISAGQRELNNKNNQIATYSTQLTAVQNQLATTQNQLTIRNNAFDVLTQQFNALQIESNNKNKKAEHIATKNNSEVILCEDCYKKIEEQKHPKCKECSKELELPFFNIARDKVKYCLDCWTRIEKDWRKDNEALVGYHDKSKEHPIPVKWNEEKNAWCQWGNKTKVIWQPSQEKDQEQPCPKCGETAKHICPTFKMCEACLNSFDKWTKEELEFGIETYQKSLQDNPSNQIVRQKLSQIQAEYEKRRKEEQERPEPQQNQPQQNINNQPTEVGKCIKCKKNPESIISKSYSNGILVWGFCDDCEKSAIKDTTCYKCRQNQRIGKSGTKDWNFCAKCLQEQASNKKHCPECQKIIVWGNWEDEQWKDKESRDGGKEGEFCSWVCMHKAFQRNPDNPHNKRQVDDFLKEPLPPAKPTDLCERCGMDCRTDIKVTDKGSKFSKTWMTCSKKNNCLLHWFH